MPDALLVVLVHLFFKGSTLFHHLLTFFVTQVFEELIHKSLDLIADLDSIEQLNDVEVKDKCFNACVWFLRHGNKMSLYPKELLILREIIDQNVKTKPCSNALVVLDKWLIL